MISFLLSVLAARFASSGLRESNIIRCILFILSIISFYLFYFILFWGRGRRMSVFTFLLGN